MIKGEGTLLQNERMERFTSWRVGGVGTYLYKPNGVLDLQHTLEQIPKDVSILWLGLGSNTLIRDGGFKGVTILTQGAMSQLSLIGESKVKVQAGVSCATMARFCARNNLARAEFWAGIPGTMGGALRMNAGCFDGETWRYLDSVETINRQGIIKVKTPEDFKIAYRCVDGLNNDEWFLSATFNLPSGDKAKSLDTIKQLLARRAETQPTGEYNCGSVFRNPDGDYAARLIESCDLKGIRIGGAYVSPKHANFITNAGSATAQDIENLIEHIYREVKQSTGVTLQREVHIMGSKQ